MKCIQAKSLFSPYLDGAVTGKQMRELSEHLETCAGCHREYKSLRNVQQLLSNMGPRRAPSDLALRLRVAISHEAARVREPYWTGARIRLENALNAFMVPAMAGLTTAVILFGVMMGLLAQPERAGSADVPLTFYTAPQLQQSAFAPPVLESMHDDSLVIETVVDSHGRVLDYRVLSNDRAESSELSSEVKNALIFTTFRPATSMGRPTSGRVILSFSKVRVRG